MTNITDRNYEIAAARLGGQTISAIAAAFGISQGYVSSIASNNAWMVRRRAHRPVPPGLTIRAAIAIEDAIGMWPSENDKAKVQEREMDIMRSPSGRRVILREIGAWLYGAE